MFINIDIGGTKIKIEAINQRKIVRKISVKTPKSKRKFIKILKEFLTQINKNYKIAGINIGCAGIINATKVIFSPNIPYLKNFDFRLIFPKPLLLKVNNDARYFLERLIKKNIYLKNKKVLLFTIGTGIGRAYAKNKKVKKIKKFEYPEIWEKEYQKIRDTKNDNFLAEFLTKKLSFIIAKYKPDIIIFSGGVLRRKNFFQKIKRKLTKNKIAAKIINASYVY